MEIEESDDDVHFLKKHELCDVDHTTRSHTSPQKRGIRFFLKLPLEVPHCRQKKEVWVLEMQLGVRKKKTKKIGRNRVRRGPGGRSDKKIKKSNQW